jgi:hypothetical protein
MAGLRLTGRLQEALLLLKDGLGDGVQLGDPSLGVVGVELSAQMDLVGQEGVEFDVAGRTNDRLLFVLLVQGLDLGGSCLASGDLFLLHNYLI